MSRFQNASSLPPRKYALIARRLALLAWAALAISCGGGGSGTAVSPPIVTVSPNPAAIGTGSSMIFTAVVQNSSNTAVSWQVNTVPGGNATVGTVDSSGLYKAPAAVPSPPTVLVTALLQSNSSASGSAVVTIELPLAISPSIASLTTSQVLQMQASGPNIGNGNVTWSVDNVLGGSASTGLITSLGLYSPPPSAGVHTITATTIAPPLASAMSSVAVTTFAGNYSWRNDPRLTGQNRLELALTPATVSSGQFGKFFSCAVDGYVYAQPLYVANLTTQPNVVHNVVYVANEHDSVYAFDADASPCQQIWKVNFVNNLAGITTVPSGDIPSSDIVPEIGITGTPVIDPGTGTLYVVAATKENGAHVQRLHALDITTGAEKFSGPVVIQAFVTGTGDGNDGLGKVPWNALQENQMPALLLSGGTVYIAFGSHANDAPFHGWLLAYNGTTLAQTAAFNSTPNASGGGIGQSGAPPAADGSGNLFAATGNGTFDVNIPAAPSHVDYGQSLLRLPSAPVLAVADFITPFTQALLNSSNPVVDFGSSGVLLLPDLAGSVSHPNLAILGSQSGALYVVDRANLGGFTLGGPDKAVQVLTLAGPNYGTPALWQGAAQNTVYVAASGDTLKAFPLTNGLLPVTPTSQSSATFASPGASPVLSSNGTGNGIVWLLDTSGYCANGFPATPAVLHAYDAGNLATEVYNSSHLSTDAAGPAVRFSVPTVANGKVYVGSQNNLTVYYFLK